MTARTPQTNWPAFNHLPITAKQSKLNEFLYQIQLKQFTWLMLRIFLILHYNYWHYHTRTDAYFSRISYDVHTIFDTCYFLTAMLEMSIAGHDVIEYNRSYGLLLLASGKRKCLWKDKCKTKWNIPFKNKIL